jgi:hypothetical protein
MERGLYHPIEFSCEHMAVVEIGDVETNVAPFNLHSLLAHPGRSSSANSTAVRPFGAPPQTRQSCCFFEQIAEAGAHQVMVISQQYLQHIAPYVLARKRILVFHSDRN